VVQNVESKILLYYKHTGESNLKEENWSENGESTEMRKENAKHMAWALEVCTLGSIWIMSLGCNIFWKYLYIASLCGRKWYMELLLLARRAISLLCARFMWKFIYQQSNAKPAYLSVPNRETSEISTLVVLTQLFNSRLVCDFERETYKTELHFW